MEYRRWDSRDNSIEDLVSAKKCRCPILDMVARIDRFMVDLRESPGSGPIKSGGAPPLEGREKIG